VPALVIVALGLLTGCAADSRTDGAADVLTGTVRLNGESVEFVMLVVTGPDGKTVSGPHLPGGRYKIEKPPGGQLKFKFASAPPGGGSPSGDKAPQSPIPARYFTDRNELSFEYTGGPKQYDIDLKP
jgi:hypothetical protein